MAGPNDEVIQIDSDSDQDEQLRRAIALSLQDQSVAPPNGSSSKAEVRSSSQTSSQVSKAQFGSLHLDRRAMEEERIQRLRKRTRSSSHELDEPPLKRPPSHALPSQRDTKSSPHSTRISVPYPDGTVKRTWVRGYDRTDDDIKIEEILQKKELQLALISSFQWDEEWMLSKIDITRTNLVLLAFAQDDAQKAIMRANVPSNIRFCFPPMHGPGAMHSKLQLLKYAGYLRIVIPTGNFTPYDWGETGAMENMVFIIDLPKVEGSDRQKPTAFQTELEYFLATAGVGEKMLASISHYDFAKTNNIGFIHTIPGGHMEESLRRVGYCGLGAGVNALGLASSEPIQVDVACASLGSLRYEFVEAIYRACQGIDGISVPSSAATSHRSGAKMAAAAAAAQLQDRFRIYFPTEKMVSKSRGGRQAGGTICFQERWWRSPNFPRELMRDVVNTRDGLLMHTKVIFVRRPRCGKNVAGQPPGWAYIGSANLSESAWGRLSRDKTTGKAKLSCRNWECGVLIPIRDKNVGQSRAGVDLSMSMFDGIVPVPMRVPGPEYGADDEPWFFSGN